MLKKLNSTIVVALCTGAGLTAFARYEASVTVSAIWLYVAAAAICLLPVLSALARHKSCVRS